VKTYVLADGTAVHTLLSAEASQAKRFLTDVAAEQGWLPPEGAIDGYPANSVYFLHSADERVVGAVKAVMGNDNEGLPILDVWPEFDLRGREDVAELSILALAKDSRGHGRSFLPLSAELWRHCALEGVSEVWAELEPRMVAIYRRFGWPMEVMGELREYWGDPLYPCRVGIKEAVLAYRDKARTLSAYEAALLQFERDMPYQT